MSRIPIVSKQITTTAVAPNAGAAITYVLETSEAKGYTLINAVVKPAGTEQDAYEAMGMANRGNFWLPGMVEMAGEPEGAKYLPFHVTLDLLFEVDVPDKE